jgi:glycosyltransferase involved in cell wall biosynthesis
MQESAGKRRLKVLFLSQRFLLPMDAGGKIRTGKILEKIKGDFDVTLVSNVESPKDDPYLDQIRELCAEFHAVPWKEIDKYTARFYLKVFARLFSRYPVTVINDYSREIEAKIKAVLQNGQYDLLICDFLQPSLNFRHLTGYPTLLFQHNVESVIVRRHFQVARNIVTKLFWWLQWVKMDRYERAACHKFTGVVVVSETDKEILENRFGARRVFVIPTGIDTDYFAPRTEQVEKDSLVFVGSMDWLPNEDAILFFAREVLGKIKEVIPTIRLTVVGRNPSAHLRQELAQYPEITIVGRVDDVRPFLSRHTLSILPLRIGGGTRIKVYEAMAMGKVVVSTHIGTEGLPVRDGEHVVLVDTAGDFARAVIQLLRDSERRKTIERAARHFVQTNCSWEKAASVFADACRQVAHVHKERLCQL